MNRFTSAPLLLGFLVLTNPAVSLQDPAHREKVAEGEYSEWQDGHPLKDTGLTWTIWHTKDGLEVEATLPSDKGAFIAAALADPGSAATADFKKEIQNSSVTRSIDLQLTKLLVLQRMILEGVSLGDLKQVRVANCQVSSIGYKGRKQLSRAPLNVSMKPGISSQGLKNSGSMWSPR
jgi:hypothetical protein